MEWNGRSRHSGAGLTKPLPPRAAASGAEEAFKLQRQQARRWWSGGGTLLAGGGGASNHFGRRIRLGRQAQNHHPQISVQDWSDGMAARAVRFTATTGRNLGVVLRQRHCSSVQLRFVRLC
jgi:hypothetical protein